MTKTTKAQAKKPRDYNIWIAKVLIAVLGVVLSIVLHELFHVFAHWGEAPHIHFFPGNETIAEIIVWIPNGYDLEGEEMVAYAITLLTILVTAMIIFKVDDANDKRSAAQILFPNDKEMQKLSPPELLALVDRADMAEIHKTVKRKNK